MRSKSSRSLLRREPPRTAAFRTGIPSAERWRRSTRPRAARPPTYFMVNCAHPTHFEDALAGPASWRRLRGLRANASLRSNAELDQAKDLDDGDPVELGAQYAALRRRHPQLCVLGGCCGTDHRHVEQMLLACRPAATP